MMDARQAAEICGKPKPQNKGWMCQCPAHEDDKASLKIDDGDKVPLIVKCFAGCDNDDVIRAMKSIGAWPSAPDVPAKVSRKQSSKSTARGGKRVKKTAKKTAKKIVAEYDYVDENGELLFQAIRYSPKDFRQRRPSSSGGWDWKLGDVRLVPFALPEVLSAIKKNRVIFIVEGEKDVLAMRDRLDNGGCVATCSPMGAGKWKPEFNDYFNGAIVVVIPDNDTPGRKHAANVADQLRGHARKVRILELPEIPEH